MAIKKVKGGFVASYAGKSRTFKTRDAAEKWAAKFTGKTEIAAYKKGRKNPKKGRIPRRMA